MKVVFLVVSLLLPSIVHADFFKEEKVEVPYKGWPVKRPMPKDCWGTFERDWSNEGSKLMKPFGKYKFNPNKFDDACWEASLKKPSWR